MVVGYTTGGFDLFHIGHLNILRNAKSLCDKLIVGVNTDELYFEQKKKKTIFPFNHRMEIVRSLKFVDAVIPQENLDKFEAWKILKFDIYFHGSDRAESERFKGYENKLSQVGVKTIYLPYTKTISTSLIIEKIKSIEQGTSIAQSI